MKFFSLLLIFVIALMSERSQAYPQFIGLGYTSCLTCHFSPTGGGALNDYGRALYAAEVARRPFWSSSNDEQLAESSGFLGKTTLPFWIRPGIKYRRLVQQTNPGSSQMREVDLKMQTDLNLNLFLDEGMSKGLITTIAHLAKPTAALPNRPISSEQDDLMMREYFWRQSFKDTHWISAGFLDKPFGIKHADHTATNRTTLPLAQNDQVHGIQYSRFGKKTELHVMGYMGNLHLAGTEHRQGLSGVFEYEPIEKMRYGVSLLYQEDQTDPFYGFSTHAKIGLLDHNSWLIEVGARKQEEYSPFVFSQLSYYLTRGVFLEPTLQFFQNELTSEGEQRIRSGIGILYFPFQRVELRTQILHTSSKGQNTIGTDTWTAQAQLHLSL